MKKPLIAVVAFVSACCLAGSAHAQCSFDAPAKARGLKTSLARSFTSCPSITFPAPTTLTTAGVPACVAPLAHSPYRFGDKGKCSVKTTHLLERPCSDGSTGECSNLSISAKCVDIETPGMSPTNEPGWKLVAMTRWTIADAQGVDMTTVDFPIGVFFPQAKNGKLKLKLGTTTVMSLLYGPGAAFPGCSSVEVVRIGVHDPHGSEFATIGSSTR